MLYMRRNETAIFKQGIEAECGFESGLAKFYDLHHQPLCHLRDFTSMTSFTAKALG